MRSGGRLSDGGAQRKLYCEDPDLSVSRIGETGKCLLPLPGTRLPELTFSEARAIIDALTAFMAVDPTQAKLEESGFKKAEALRRWQTMDGRARYLSIRATADQVQEAFMPGESRSDRHFIREKPWVCINPLTPAEQEEQAKVEELE